SGLATFITRILDPHRSRRFIEHFDAFARRAALLGALGSLIQVTLKSTMPGVPDFYQGTELWELSLVDPDNRRPVDLSARASLLHSVGGAICWRELTDQWADGRIKLALIHRLLALRREFPQVFAIGRYRPLEVAGRDHDEIIAFARDDGR